jgi:SAM-dependent methyltransferase
MDRALYLRHADYYEKIYHFKDYAGESERLHRLLAEAGLPDGATLLDAACGVGLHLAHLQRWYRVSGFDLSPGEIDIARQRLPEVPLWVADMRDVELAEPVDAIVNLFSAIGYLIGEEQVQAAARAFYRALKPGGIALVELWFQREDWDQGRPALNTWEGPDLKLARLCVADVEEGPEGSVARMDMHWSVAARGRPVEHFVDQHRLWLCPHPLMVQIFQSVGFEVEYQGGSRGTLFCRRPL